MTALSRLSSETPFAVTARPSSAPLRFCSIPISETGPFPPPPAAECWAYLTVNVEIALSLPHSPALQQLVRSTRARISVDGQWVWWALRRKYPQRPLQKLSGSDLIFDLAAFCAAEGRRLLLLGSRPEINAGAVGALRERWPALAVDGHAPAFHADDEAGDAALRHELLDAVERCRPDYVVLGLGAPKEQRLAARVLPELDGRVRGLLCFGGAIDMAGGAVQRAPRSWQRLGLEACWRVWQQPARLGRTLRVLRVLPRLARGAY